DAPAQRTPAARDRRLPGVDGRRGQDPRRRRFRAGGCTAARNRPRPDRGRPPAAHGPQAPWLPDARCARQGAQEGGPQEGAQAAAVLQALVERAASARRLFGTDGVRGVAGEFLTAELALGLGRAAATIVRPEAPQVLIVRDTRESGQMLETALAAGVAAAGGHALLGGVLPTPGVSLLIRRYGLDLGAVVSASHNPYADNGIKFFGSDGTKLSDEQEERVEAVLAEPRQPPAPGRVRELHGAAGDYLRELELRFQGLDLSGKRVLLDCANGATYRVAPEIFRRLGAEVTAVAVEPDGRNINDGCGST